ncbi:hypothetical protein OG760_32625 [Streptomyces sp. NBC_00963]|uniref:hypothetical protein n=1 Tax=Streptomyces sp. NBC_00963 TaxID=2903697 RepID=UPI00386D9CB7|nr:hypothetical protein OG760_32625 [Streptomyces sp. NBC_00963]
MTTLLEQRYRTVLRMLPAYYRAEREEEMVETYLDDMDEADQDLARPAWGEVASIAALSVRTRLGSAGAPPRYAAIGSAVRLFALLSVALLAADTLTQRALPAAWLTGAAPKDRADFMRTFTGNGVLMGVAQTLLWVLPLAWPVAYAALLRDRRRAAFTLALLGAAPSLSYLVGRPMGQGLGVAPSALTVVTAATAWLTVAAVGCGYHSDAPPARLPFAPAGPALLGTCVLMGGSMVVWPQGADSVWGSGTVVVAAGCAWWVARIRASRRGAGTPEPALPLALAVLGTVVLAQRCALMGLLTSAQAPYSTIVGGEIQAAALAALVVTLTVSGTRGLLARTKATAAGAAPHA